jgi:putative colanic acid biosynthesis glycosyltransferase WcaI
VILRVLILTQYFQPETGAPQIRLAAMCREFVRLGHEVEVVTAFPNYPTGKIYPDYRGKFYSRELWEGVLVHRVWLYAATGAGFKRLLNYATFTAMSIFGFLRARKPDFIFIESPPLFLSVPAFMAAWCWRVPMIFNVADLWPDSVREMGMLRDGAVLRFAEWLELWSYRKATYVNAVTDGIREVLTAEKGVPTSKILFLPNGVDTNLFKPKAPDRALSCELGLSTKKVILYAGTLGIAQGLQVGLDAMRLLEDELPDVQLVFIGGGSEHDQLKAAASRMGLKNVTFLLPQAPDYVARLYSVAYAGFVSLRNLPFTDSARPSKVYPIMASGKPVIYSGSGEGARLVEGAGAGLVVTPEDPEALAAAIRTLISKPDLAEGLGKNGRKYAEKHLNWSNLIHDWLGQFATADR